MGHKTKKLKAQSQLPSLVDSFSGMQMNIVIHSVLSRLLCYEDVLVNCYSIQNRESVLSCLTVLCLAPWAAT